MVRLFHWSLVTCVFLNAFVLEEGEQWHRWIGYAATIWVATRVVWGFIGSPYARFSAFWPSKRAVFEQLNQLKAGEVKTHIGHSPLGAVMMIALCLNVLLLGFTGWLMGTDLFWGEDWLEEVHDLLSNFLLSLALLHASAALVLGRREGVNLVAAMVHGHKNYKKIEK